MTTNVDEALTPQTATAWMRCFAAEIVRHKDELARLDAAVGDADHGINMERGSSAVRRKLEEARPDDLGALFTLVGNTMISVTGGASGVLYGTAFLRMGGALSGHSAAGVAELGQALAAAYEGLARRGKSGRGEKTMLDAWGPALDAFEAARRDGHGLREATDTAARAAAAGAQETSRMAATKGRASSVGEGGIGHPDPGATSTALLFQALAESLAG